MQAWPVGLRGCQISRPLSYMVVLVLLTTPDIWTVTTSFESNKTFYTQNSFTRSTIQIDEYDCFKTHIYFRILIKQDTSYWFYKHNPYKCQKNCTLQTDTVLTICIQFFSTVLSLSQNYFKVTCCCCFCWLCTTFFSIHGIGMRASHIWMIRNIVSWGIGINVLVLLIDIAPKYNTKEEDKYIATTCTRLW